MRSKTTKILLVEDNPADARYTQELLATSQYSIVTANTLVNALEIIQRERVDIALLDLALPDSIGVQTVAKVLAENKELPIVVLTGLEDVECAIEALRVGAYDYIVKGKLNEKLLLRSINLAIEEKKHQLIRANLLSKTRLNKLSAAVGDGLISCHSLSDFLEHCSRALCEHLNLIHAHLWTLNDQLNEFHLQAASGKCNDLLTDSVYVSLPKNIAQPFNSKILAQIAEQITSKTLAYCESPAGLENDFELIIQPLTCDERLFGIMTLHMHSFAESLAQPSLNMVAEQIARGMDRKLSEAARSLLANIVQCSEDGIISFDAENKIKTWNIGAERIFGYSSDEAAGKDLSLFLPISESSNLAETEESILHGNSLENIELNGKRKDGTTLEVALTVSSLLDSGAKEYGTSIIVRDISARRDAERIEQTHTKIMATLRDSASIEDAAPKLLEAIRDAQSFDVVSLWLKGKDIAKLACIATSATDIPGISDLETITNHLKLAGDLFCLENIANNPNGSIILEIDRVEDPLKRSHSENLKPLSMIVYPIICGNECLGAIELHKSATLSSKNDAFDKLMKPICYQVGQFIEKKDAEKTAERATRARLRIGEAITENAPIGIAWLDNNLVITEVNRAFCAQLNLVREEIQGNLILKIPTGIPGDWLLDVVESGLPMSHSNYKMDISEKEIYCDLTIWPVKNDGDTPDGLVVLSVDVTERVELSRQKEDFVATLTHDLKNPLIGQTHIMQGLLDGKLGPLNPEQIEVLTIVNSGTAELLDLIKMLLDVYRYENGKNILRLEEVELREEIDGILTQFKPLYKRKNLKVTVTDHLKSPAIQVDRMAIRRVLSNLVNNAIKFTGNQGNINLTCETKPVGVSISVKDNGYGIPKEELPYIFQRFSIGKNQTVNKTGSGLGLYLCKQIVEQHGGKIFCKSSTNTGTEITFTLPVDAESKDKDL